MKNGFWVVLILAATSMGWAAQTPSKTEAYQLYLKSIIEESQNNLATAQEYLDKAITLAPTSAYLHSSAAEFAFRQNQLPKAVQSVEKAILLEPANVKTYILAGQIYWAAGDQEKAEARLKKAVALDPDEAEALVNLAMAVTPKEPQKAVKLYEDFLKRHPGELEIQERVAQLYATLGDVDKSKEAWERVLEIEPDSIRAHLASAQIAEVLKDTTSAIVHYETVLEQDPNNLPLLLRVGELRYRSDQMNEAYEAFARAQAIAPESPSANFWLALVSEQRGDWEQAIKLLTQVAETAPEPGVLLRLSFYYAQNGQPNEAIKILRQLSEQEPENTDFLHYLSVGYEQNKQYGEAIKVVEKLILIDPQNPDHYFHIATLYDRSNKFQKAEASLLKAIDLDPQFHMALNYLGYSYADRNVKLAEAEDLLNRAVALDPHNTAYLDSMGWVYYRQGKLTKAEDFLKQATKTGRDPLIWEHLGDVQFSSGGVLAAIHSWETSLRLDPKQPAVGKKLSQALLKIPVSEKVIILLDRAQADGEALGSIKGLTEIAVGEGKPKFKTRAQIEFERKGGLVLQTPGPLGAPLFLVSRSSEGVVEYGAVHPILQSVEPEVVRVYERLETFFNGQVLKKINRPEFQEKASSKDGKIESVSADVALVFDVKSGLLESISWSGAGRRESLRLSKYSLDTSPTLPLRYEWRDEVNHFVFQLTLVRPLVSSTLVTHENPLAPSPR